MMEKWFVTNQHDLLDMQNLAQPHKVSWIVNYECNKRYSKSIKWISLSLILLLHPTVLDLPSSLNELVNDPCNSTVSKKWLFIVQFPKISVSILKRMAKALYLNANSKGLSRQQLCIFTRIVCLRSASQNCYQSLTAILSWAVHKAQGRPELKCHAVRNESHPQTCVSISSYCIYISHMTQTLRTVIWVGSGQLRKFFKLVDSHGMWLTTDGSLHMYLLYNLNHSSFQSVEWTCFTFIRVR